MQNQSSNEDKKMSHERYKDDLASEGSWTTDDESADAGSFRMLTWKDGSRYKGEIDSEGRPHGRGKLERNGYAYDGEWVHGAPFGKGTFCVVGSNSTQFNGRWGCDIVTGYVRLVFPDGAAYEGDWKNNRPEGTGVFINPHGVMFRGEWRNGVFQPHLSGYDARGIVTCNRHFHTGADISNYSPNTGNGERIEAHSSQNESLLQYNGAPGEPDSNIHLVGPHVAMKKGIYDQEAGIFTYDTAEFESPVRPDDPTNSGCRLDSGYLYRSRYCTEVWPEVLQVESREETVTTTEAAATRKKLGPSKYDFQRDQPVVPEPDSDEPDEDEEFPVDLEPESDQSGMPTTATCMTCPDPVGPYMASYLNSQPTHHSRSASMFPHPQPPIQPVIPSQRQSPPRMMVPNEMGMSSGEADNIMQRNPIPIRSNSAVTVCMPSSNNVSHMLSLQPQQRAPSLNVSGENAGEAEKTVTMPVPLEAVSTIELTMPKLKVNKVQIDYPVYAPRIIEVPVAAESLTPEGLAICEAIQERIDKLTEPQTPTMLENITDTIVEQLEEMSNFLS